MVVPQAGFTVAMGKEEGGGGKRGKAGVGEVVEGGMGWGDSGEVVEGGSEVGGVPGEGGGGEGEVGDGVAVAKAMFCRLEFCYR